MKKQSNYLNSIPSNMSVTNCCVDSIPYGDSTIFRVNNQPVDDGRKSYTINPSVFQGKVMTDYVPVKFEEKTVYKGYDAKLINSMRGSAPMLLDRPPLNSEPQQLDQIYCPLYGSYDGKYNSYKDIDTGYIMYYVDGERENPYTEPVFSTTAKITGYLYKDPMDSVKPTYDRIPITRPPKTTIKRDNYYGKLSWIEDSTEHREDMLSYQMRKRMQQEYVPRWSSVLSE